MSVASFDLLAPHYRQYATRREGYCRAVDRQILQSRRARTESMLDVGSGDGSRAVRLAAGLGVSRLVLSDPSGPMVDLCRALGPHEVWQCPGEALPSGVAPFDLITCLWNVLGHVEGTNRRVEALVRMGALLAPGGTMFVDVLNRYNASTAGRWRVAGRLLRDAVRPSDLNGDVTFGWRVAGQNLHAAGHLFSEGEMRMLIAAAGLRVAGCSYLDYADGRPRGRWSGQMLYVLERPPDQLVR